MKANLISKDFAVWEIEEFDLPEVSFEVGEVYEQGANDPRLRNTVHIPDADESNSFYSVWNKHTDLLEKQIKKDSINNLTVWQMWINEVENFKWGDSGTVRILSDSPGFNMHYHVDNRLIFGVLLINLIDNTDSTVFENGYVAPSKKGTGIFMMNNNDYHKIGVTSDRLIGYQTLAVNKCLV